MVIPPGCGNRFPGTHRRGHPSGNPTPTTANRGQPTQDNNPSTIPYSRQGQAPVLQPAQGSKDRSFASTAPPSGQVNNPSVAPTIPYSGQGHALVLQPAQGNNNLPLLSTAPPSGQGRAPPPPGLNANAPSFMPRGIYSSTRGHLYYGNNQQDVSQPGASEPKNTQSIGEADKINPGQPVAGTSQKEQNTNTHGQGLVADLQHRDAGADNNYTLNNNSSDRKIENIPPVNRQGVNNYQTSGHDQATTHGSGQRSGSHRGNFQQERTSSGGSGRQEERRRNWPHQGGQLGSGLGQAGITQQPPAAARGRNTMSGWLINPHIGRG